MLYVDVTSGVTTGGAGDDPAGEDEMSIGGLLAAVIVKDDFAGASLSTSVMLLSNADHTIDVWAAVNWREGCSSSSALARAAATHVSLYILF